MIQNLSWDKKVNKPHVLVVDDEPTIRLTFEAFLAEFGCVPHSAGSLQEAQEALKHHEYDLALIDIVLNEDSGMALLEEIRTHSPHTPVVMITGRPALETATASVRHGAFDYLQKPIEKADILRVTSRALEHKALLDEKRQLQHELRESERQYRLLAENAGDVIWTLGPDLHLTYASPATKRIFGYLPEDILNRPVEDFILPEDAGSHAGWRAWAESLNNEAPDTSTRLWQLRLVTSEQEALWTESSTSAMYDNGRFIGILGVTRDITDRKRTELALSKAVQDKERYRRNLDATFRSIPDAIITVDDELRLISTNAAAQDICGLGPDSPPGEFFHDQAPCGSANCLEIVRTTLRTRKPVRSMLVPCGRQGQPKRHVELNCTPLLDESDMHYGAVLVVKDVTRLMDLEKRLGERKHFRNIVGKSKPMQEIYTLIEQLANVDSTVLVQGETGTGKELVADALHYGGVREKGPLIKVNCSALSENLLESELFGHVRGAFTGAIRDKEGRIQAASGGTLFLDEIGDISPLIQLKLLRFLEQKEYERVGESITRKADVRVIAASNVDLLEKVNQGRFRQDLYYRLNVMVINLPSLRERTEDIPLFVDHFLSHFGNSFHKKMSGMSNDALEVLMRYPWPGNVRELKHSLEHACILCQEGLVGLHHLPRELLSRKRMANKLPLVAHNGQSRTLEKQDILDALEHAEGNKAKAARILGIDRTTLYRKLAQLNIEL